MNDKDVEAILRRELFKIAPDIDMADVELSADIREEFDIDSMDFLNLVVALSKALNMNIPEADYSKISTYNALVAYLGNQANA
ncbi:MAG: acyl carrier protein [Hyphomicrobiales bacterium]|nr:acyl carrier protein [Hyphomicrobiales bacterium]